MNSRNIFNTSKGLAGAKSGQPDSTFVKFASHVNNSFLKTRRNKSELPIQPILSIAFNVNPAVLTPFLAFSGLLSE